MGVLCFILGEILVRLLLPASTFWGYDNLHRAVDTPGVYYTYRADYHDQGFGVKLDTNNLGFRGTDWTVQKPDNTFRIAILGDSHAFGYGVAYEQTMAALLTQKLQQNQSDLNYELLNFAVDGYNTHQQLAVLKQQVLTYQINLAIIVPSSNDHDAAMVVDADGWQRTIPDGMSAEQAQTALYHNPIRNFLKKSHFFLYLNILKLRLSLLINPPETQPEADWMTPLPDTLNIHEPLRLPVYQPLQEMVAILKQNQIQVAIALFSSGQDYRQTIHHLAQAQQIPMLDMLSLFPEVHSWTALLQQFSLGWNSHLNAEANRRWAVALYDLLQSQQLGNKP